MDTSIYRCPGCKANLLFDPPTQRWKCNYCGNSYSEADLNQAQENSDFKTSETPSNQTLNIYRCSACGAEMVADENTTSTFCVYCGSSGILKSKFTGTFKPDLIIPFRMVKEDALKAYKAYKKGKWFAPKEFGDPKTIGKITGVYIPFWLYDGASQGNASYTGEKNSRSYRRGDYIIHEADVYNIYREGNIRFEKVPCDGSRKFDDDLMDSIEPFNYKEFKEFNMSYLSGFLSEKYDVSQEENKGRAQLRMKNTLYDKLRSTVYGYGSVVNKTQSSKTTFSKITYALMPVWMLNTKYKDKMYAFAMNGQTGKLIGNVPIDKSKLLKITLAIFAGSLALFCIIAQLFFMD